MIRQPFYPLRYSLDNVFLTHKTIDEGKRSKQDLIFLKVDFAKVYDKVFYDFLFLAMKHLGMATYFIAMIKLLF